MAHATYVSHAHLANIFHVSGRSISDLIQLRTPSSQQLLQPSFAQHPMHQLAWSHRRKCWKHSVNVSCNCRNNMGMYKAYNSTQTHFRANGIESPAGCTHCKLRMCPRDGWSVTALVTALSWSFKRIKIKPFCVCWLDMSVPKSNVRSRDDSVPYAD